MNGLAGTGIGLILLVAPLIAEQPSPEQKEWALATTGILTEMNGRRHDLLGEMEPSPANRDTILSQLDYWWGIHSRNELIRTINALRFREPNGWDLMRSITLCRWGYQAQFLTQDEAWEGIMPVAQSLQQMFSSWRELGRSYLVRRDQWSRGVNWDHDAARADLQSLLRELLSLQISPWKETTWRRVQADLSPPHDFFSSDADYAYRKLLFRKTSPWRRIPWDLDLGGAPVKSGKAAQTTIGFLTVVSRPAGLTCFSVELVDRIPQASLMPLQYSHEQGVTHRRVQVGEFFPRELSAFSKT